MKVVLILGAGASIDYGYPLGSELKNYIITNLSQNTSSLYKYLIKKHDQLDIGSFVSSFQSSGYDSIDSFLENRQTLKTLGKEILFFSIADYESKYQTRLKESGWYNKIKTKWFYNLREFESKKISFVTFNYDRSLDFFLYNSFIHGNGLSAKEASYYMNEIDIIHVHGSLGGYLWEESNLDPRDYGYIDNDYISKHYNRIKVISESDKTDDEIQRARKVIRESDSVIINGFGYHTQNLRRIFKDNRSNDRQIFYANMFQMTPNEQTIAIKEFPGRRIHHIAHTDCGQAMRELINF